MAAFDRVESPDTRRPWYQDLASGVAVATVSIPAALAAGVLSLSPVGPSFLLAGAVFGLLAGAASALLSALVFRSSTVVGPVSTVCVAQSILMASLATHPDLAGHPERILAVMAVSVLLTGIVQLALAALRVGSVIEFTPYPVVAGFLNGVAFLTVGSQVLFVLGRSSWSDLLARPPVDLAGVAPLVFLAVFVALGLVMTRVLRRLPAAAVTFTLGLALYYAAVAVLPEALLGPRLTIASGALVSAFTGPGEVVAVLAGLPGALLWQIVLGALTVAAIGIVEMSMTARMVENASHRRVDKHGLQIWLGLTNVLASPMGVPSSGSLSQTAARWHSGGVGPMSDLARAALMVVVATIGIGLLDAVPVIVVSGQLVLVGIGIVDAWSLRQVVRMARSSNAASRRVAKRSIVVIAIVMVATASGFIVQGAALGIAAACWIFIADSASPLIRARLWGDAARSKKARPLRDLGLLRESLHEVHVLVLQGPVFFGNAVELTRALDRLPAETRIVLLDLRRVTSIDVSAIATIGALSRHASRTSRLIAVCGVPRGLSFMMEEMRTEGAAGQMLVFDDREAGLEWAEDLILSRAAAADGADLASGLADVDVTQGFGPGQLEAFTRRLTPLGVDRGGYLCREGDEGDVVWILVQGTVSIWVSAGAGGDGIRVGSFAAGTAVGEIAFVNGTRRTASIVADGPVRCFCLSRADFEALCRDDPMLAVQFYRNVSRILAERLKVTTDQVRASETA